jgi:hypothetical protein
VHAAFATYMLTPLFFITPPQPRDAVKESRSPPESDHPR